VGYTARGPRRASLNAALGLPHIIDTEARALTTNIAVPTPALGFIFIGCAIVWVWTNGENK
jgi:hypothetical protein